MLCDALGLPIKFIVTGGQVNDCTQAVPLLKNKKANYVLADKAYDGDAILDIIKEIAAVAVIPPKANRIIKREYDKDLYKERNIIERLFNKLKQFRRIATRYEKILNNFEGLIYLASIFLWLK